MTAIARLESSGVAAKVPLTEPGRLFEERRVFFASAILRTEYAAFAALPPVYSGRKISFVVPSDGFLGSASAAGEITADFGDGQGFRQLRVDDPVEVSYVGFGPKIVTVHSAGPQGVLAASFGLESA